MHRGTVPLDPSSDIEPSDLDPSWSALVAMSGEGLPMVESHLVPSRTFLGAMSDPGLLDTIDPEGIGTSIERIASDVEGFDVRLPFGDWYVRSRRSRSNRVTVVHSNRVVQEVRRIWMEHWSIESVRDRDSSGMDMCALPSVLLQRAETPFSSGRMTSTAPSVIESVWGTSAYMDMGIGTPDRITARGHEIDMSPSEQRVMTVIDDTGMTIRPVAQAKVARPSIDRDQARALLSIGERIDRCLGRPHEVHWEWHRDGPRALSLRPLGPALPPGRWATVDVRGIGTSMSPLSRSILLRGLQDVLGKDGAIEHMGGIMVSWPERAPIGPMGLLPQDIHEARLMTRCLVGRTMVGGDPEHDGHQSDLGRALRRLGGLLEALIAAMRVRGRWARTLGVDRPYVWGGDMDAALVRVGAMLSEDDAGAGSAIADVMARFGQRAQFFDLAHPRWVEDPTSLMMEAWSRSTAQRPADGRGGWGPIALVDRALAQLEGEAWDVSAELRHAFLSIGERLTEKGAIPRAEDVFLLTLDEVLFASDGRREFDEGRIANRRRATQRMGRMLPDMVVDGRASYRAPPVTASSGTPASPGVHTGRARVIRCFDDLLGTVTGDVLIARTLRPEWSPILRIAGALVTSRDGALSIGSRMAREHAVPCVVGAPESLMHIEDGRIVTVDGSKGMVRTHIIGDARIPPIELDTRRAAFHRRFLNAIDAIR